MQAQQNEPARQGYLPRMTRFFRTREPWDAKPFGELVEHRILMDLLRRAGYLILLFVVCATLVFVYAAPSDSPNAAARLQIWYAGLWGFFLLYGVILSGAVRMETEFTHHQARLARMAVCVALILLEWWWMSVVEALEPQSFRDVQVSRQFELGQRNFFFLTFLGHGAVAVLLSVSRLAVVAAIAGGLGLAFWLHVTQYLDFPNPSFRYIISGQIVVYVLIGVSIAFVHRRAQKRTIYLEIEQTRAQRRQRHANEFLTSVSHDLRQPLSSISLKLSSLKSRGLESITEEFYDDLVVETRAMQSLVEGSLDLSRIEAGNLIMHARELALPHLLEEVVSTLRPAAKRKNLHIDLDAGPFVVRSDQNALVRVVRNLIDNAIRYTPAAMPDTPGVIKVFCTIQSDNVLRISIQDFGIGIPQDKQEDVLSAFYQINNPGRDRSQGIGLGLAIVKGLTDLLDYRFGFESRENEGSTFWIELPIVSQIPLELLDGGKSEPSPDDLDGMVIALVEDEKGPREALKELLNAWGCYVIAGETPEDILSALASEDEQGTTVGFLISDYRLRHGRTGIEAIRKVRKFIGEELPAAIWTGDTLPAVLEDIERNGLKRLSKPPDKRELIQLLSANA